jgi:hypothetical protein
MRLRPKQHSPCSPYKRETLPLKQLPDSDGLRQRVVSQMSAVQASLDQRLVDRPRRNILRKPW